MIISFQLTLRSLFQLLQRPSSVRSDDPPSPGEGERPPLPWGDLPRQEGDSPPPQDGSKVSTEEGALFS